jgi:hypothetical protein
MSVQAPPEQYWPAGQETGPPDEQVPELLQTSPVVQAFPSSQLLPVVSRTQDWTSVRLAGEPQTPLLQV